MERYLDFDVRFHEETVPVRGNISSNLCVCGNLSTISDYALICAKTIKCTVSLFLEINPHYSFFLILASQSIYHVLNLRDT